MASAKRTSKQKAKPKTEPPVQGGVLVSIVPNEKGDMALSVQTLGSTTPLEAPAILALAKRQAEKALGL